MTTTQLSLFAPLTEVTYAPTQSIADRYRAFIAANPDVLAAFESVVDEWLSAGHQRVGIKSAAEQLRWRTGVRLGDDGWKINNSFVSLIARDLLTLHPEWSAAISTRELRAA